MTESNPSLSPIGRVLTCISTVGMLAIIYMLVFARTQRNGGIGPLLRES